MALEGEGREIMTKKQANYFLHRIYELLRSDEVDVTFERSRVYRGSTDKFLIIFLDPNEEILPTLIHECLHMLYLNWSETKILKHETAIFHLLSKKQIINLLQVMVHAITNSEHLPD